MRKLTFRTRLRLLILLTLLLIALTTFAVGKYITTISVHNTVTFTAELAEDVVLVESKITRKADGTYETTGETVTSGTQEYILIPGLDVPKDPRVVITGKTSIPAYLYIEIVDSTIDTHDGQPVVTYSVTSDWTDTGALGPNGGKYYKYNSKLDQAFDTATFSILADNKVYVSQHVKHADITTDGDQDLLTICAYLIEATD